MHTKADSSPIHLGFWDNLKKGWKWIAELALLVIGERLLNSVIDLVSSPFTGESLSNYALALGIGGLITIVAASVLGVLLVQHAYRWIKTANQAMQTVSTRREQQPGQSFNFPVTRIEVKDRIFTNQDIYFDGHSWNKCTFKNCNIIVERGDFDAVYCNFDGCRLTAKGGAIAIIKLGKLFFPQIPVIEPGVDDNVKAAQIAAEALNKPTEETLDQMIVAQLPQVAYAKGHGPLPNLSVHYNESDVDRGGMLVGYKIPPQLHYIANMKTKRAFWTSPLIDSLAQKGYIEIMTHKGENDLMEYLRSNYVEVLQKHPVSLKEELGIDLRQLLRDRF